MKARRKTGKRREKPKPMKAKLPRAGKAPKTPELTDAVVRRIVDALRKDAHLPTAVGSVGLDSAVMVSWLRAEGEPYETLRSLVRQALATCELDALTQAQLAAQDDKRLAFEWLRTRWPGKYAPQPMPVPQWDLGASSRRRGRSGGPSCRSSPRASESHRPCRSRRTRRWTESASG